MYINHERMPRIRMEAVRFHHAGWSTRKIARHMGFTHSAIVKWIQKAKNIPSNAHRILTDSSRPHAHPRALSNDVVSAVIAYRRKYERGALILQYFLKKDGITVSLSSIKRILKSHKLAGWSKWKKRHVYPPRPAADAPGTLVEIDTIHHGSHENRLYLYTLLDVHSRWAYAIPTLRINTYASIHFVDDARARASFGFQTMQSDHGPEFSKWFTKQIVSRGMAHRHSRIRTPNDNAHLERFNRTIQEECIERIPRSMRSWKKEIPEYLRWYNHERPHMGLNMKTPEEILRLVPRY